MKFVLLFIRRSFICVETPRYAIPLNYSQKDVRDEVAGIRKNKNTL